MSGPPKYPSTPHWPWSEKVHREDTLHDNPEFFVGKKVIITEKLDGGNTCLWNGDVYARSVSSPADEPWFAMVKKHHAWKTNKRDLRNIAIYGEDLYGVHSIEYDPLRESETFRIFAVREDNRFCSWARTSIVAHNVLNVLTVPVLAEGDFGSVEEITDFFRRELKQPSALGGEREGFVMRIAGAFHADAFQEHVCKYVRPNHVQTDEHWRRNWQPCKLKK